MTPEEELANATAFFQNAIQKQLNIKQQQIEAENEIENAKRIMEETAKKVEAKNKRIKKSNDIDLAMLLLDCAKQAVNFGSENDEKVEKLYTFAIQIITSLLPSKSSD